MSAMAGLASAREDPRLKDSATTTARPSVELHDLAPRQVYKRAGESSSTTTDVRNESTSRVPDSRSAEPQEDVASIKNSSIYKPIDTPPGYPALDFKPMILQTRVLVPLMLFYLFSLAGIGAVIAINNVGPDWLHLRQSISHIAFNYLPGFIASISTTLLRSLVQTYTRILPYTAMAAVPAEGTSQHNVHGNRLRTIHSVGDMAAFGFSYASIGDLLREGQWLTVLLNLGLILVVLVLAPLKSSFIRVSADPNGWSVHVSNSIGYALCAVYSVMFVAVSLLMLYLRKAITGLRWDPSTLASQLALLQDSNALQPFVGFDVLNRKDFVKAIKAIDPDLGALRLGYWQDVSDESRIIHGVNFTGPFGPYATRENTCANRESESYKRVLSQPTAPTPEPVVLDATDDSRANSSGDLHEEAGSSASNVSENENEWELIDRHPETRRYFNVYFALSDSFLLFAGAVNAICIIFAVIWICDGRLQNGWLVPLTSPDEPIAAFLPAFLPSFILSVFNIVFINADVFYRAMQPIAGMNTPTVADENVLLDYFSGNPLINLVKALMHVHVRVAWFTVLAPTCVFLAPVAASIILVEVEGDALRFSFQAPQFWLCFSVLFVYLISLILARPPMRYRTPRILASLADLISYCYSSALVRRPEFSVQEADDQEIHLISKVIVAKQKYQFGFYKGVDGKRHLGLDIAQKKDTDGNLVTVDSIVPGKLGIFFVYNPWWIGSKSWRPSIASAQTVGPDKTSGIHVRASTNIKNESSLGQNPTGDEDVFVSPNRIDTEALVGMGKPRLQSPHSD